MFTHITSPPRAGQTGPEATEPARRASRFDERGIALQTIIIMVVLIAIAGAVVVVIANRAGQETERLENTEATNWVAITNKTACDLAGGRPSEAAVANPVVEADFDAMEAGDTFAGCYPPAP